MAGGGTLTLLTDTIDLSRKRKLQIMNVSSSPALVTLYGDCSYLGLENILDPEDWELLGEELDFRDIEYLEEKYPELMGFWATLVKGVAKVGRKIGGGIGKAVRRKRARKKKRAAKKRAAKKREAMIQQQMYIAAMKKRKRNQVLMIGIPAAAVAVMMLTKKRSLTNETR